MKRKEPEAFPRGGASVLTPLEAREVFDQVRRDAAAESKVTEPSLLFTEDGQEDEEETPAPSKKKKSRTSGKGATAGGMKAPSFILNSVELLNPKRVSVGLKCLAVVKQVQEMELVLALPNQLTAYASITEISPELSAQIEASTAEDADTDSENVVEIPDLRSYFAVGNFVMAVVISISAADNSPDSTRKRIEVSLKPELVNTSMLESRTQIPTGAFVSGSITSEEDHGYIVSLSGAKKHSAFLHFDQCIKPSAFGSSMKTGQLVLSNVISVANGIQLSMRPEESSLVGTSSLGSFDELSVGVFVQASIREVCIRGVLVEFSTGLGGDKNATTFEAMMEWNHLPSKVTVGQKLPARILCLDPVRKEIRLSAHPAFLNWSYSPFTSRLGKMMECTVVRADDNFGLAVNMTLSEERWAEPLPGYVHISNISDAHVGSLKSYIPTPDAPPARYACRIIGVDHYDGRYLLSMKQSVLSTPVLYPTDIQVGSVMKAKIINLESCGVFAELAPNVRALCPNIYLSDIETLTQKEKMFKPGSVMKCRVIGVDSTTGKITITFRKSLLSSPLPVITSYADAKPGMIAMGMIVAVKSFGCLVTFCNGVRALVPLSECKEVAITNPSDHFTFGHTIKCRVLSVDAEKNQLRVSFKIRPVSTDVVGVLSLGQMVDGKVVSVLPESIILHLTSGHKGILPREHLTDHTSLSASLFSTIREGILLKKMMVITVNKSSVILTKKGSIISFTQAHAESTLCEGDIVPGFVKSITPTAAFIGLPHNGVGMVQMHSISDAFVSDISDYLIPGQTVVAQVLSIPDEAQLAENPNAKVRLSLKESSVFASSEISRSYQLDWLNSYFDEKDDVFFRGQGKEKKEWAAEYPLGRVVTAKVGANTPFGVIASLINGTSGYIFSKAKMIVGDEISCTILDADPIKKIVDLSLIVPKKNSETVDYPKIGQKADAVVEIVKEDYVILSLVKGGVCYALSKAFSAKLNRSKFSVGQTVKVMILQSPSSTDKADATPFVGYAPSRCLVSILTEAIKPSASKVLKESAIVEKIPLPVGEELDATIIAVKPSQLNISLSNGMKGRIHISHIFGSYSEIADHRLPLRDYSAGMSVKCRVLGSFDAKSHSYLPFSHAKTNTMMDCELVREVCDSSKICDFDSLAVGDRRLVFIQKVNQDCLMVALSPTLMGRISALDAVQLDRDAGLDAFKQFKKNYLNGSALEATVISKDSSKQVCDLSIIEAPQVGEGFWAAKIIKKDNVSLSVQLPHHSVGRIFITDVAAPPFKEGALDKFDRSDYVMCRIVGKTSQNRFDVSLSSPVESDALPTLASLNVGDVHHGYISSVGDVGAFVSLSRQLSGRVKIAELSDEFIKDFKSVFRPGMLVKCVVLSVDEANNKIELSLKKSRIEGYSTPQLGFSDLSAGMKLNGTVKKVMEYGVFVSLEGSRLSGLCHTSELTDNQNVEQPEKLYSAGDRVKVIVLKVDEEKKRISLGLKASYFTEEDHESNSDESDIDNDSMAVDSEDIEEDNEVDMNASGMKTIANDDDMDYDMSNEDKSEDESDSEETQMAVSIATLSAQNLADVEPLSLHGFTWEMPGTTNLMPQDASDDDEGNNEVAGTGKLTRRAKLAAKKRTEERISQKEKELLNGENEPESADDFERLLVASPNSSFLWIKFMAFQLQLTQVEKARKIAERALSVISFRETQERLNVWVALLNLENSFGTPESLQITFTSCLEVNDPKVVYIQMVKILERSNKLKEAEEMHSTMVKKFKTSCKIWFGFGQFLLTNGNAEKSRQLLSKSLLSLAKHKHVKIISKFAIMEFKLGEPERGRTIFEGILSNHPKRVDLWSVYLDMEMKNGSPEHARRLFERVIHMKFSTKKMKFLFKKYLDFEKGCGNDKGVEHVKQQAIAFVESLE